MTEIKKMHRRDVLKSVTAATVFSVLPRYVLGGPNNIPPSEKINIAYVGTGSQGLRVMLEIVKRSDIKIVSVCDVNKESDDYTEWGLNEISNKARELIGQGYADPKFTGCVCGREPARRILNAYYAKQTGSDKYAGCSAYADYRELLDNEKDIDAVVVATPDHVHAVISIAAMKKGKHVYCQKPMTQTIYQARRMAEVARQTKVATQVAIGVSASESTRVLCEWIWSGVIGQVREVYNWSNRPFWPQGQGRPDKVEPIPAGLDWDLWLGPAAHRPFSHAYHPFVWRGWYDFGTGALGDMGCYSFDTLFRVLKLTAPTNIETCASKEYYMVREGTKPKINSETFPQSSIVHLHFPARKDMPPVTVHWYDGGILPPKPLELTDNQQLDKEGMLFIGDKGKILCDFTGSNPRLLPESKMQQFTVPPKTLPRSVGHYDEWIRACKGGPAADANFEFTARVTEAILAGNLAIRADKQFMRWDAANLKAPDIKNADQLVNPPARPGWEIS